MESYFSTSEPSSAWIHQPFIAEMNDNEQLNLHEQHLELQNSQAVKTKYSSSSLSTSTQISQPACEYKRILPRTHTLHTIR